ncbi:MAG: SMC family ATPase [Epulopiscium sp.]|nr:SMC family ATPase [Candidatus Epulonipiscium sp.]
MRPILLEIEAFGPFAKVQKIDFEVLDDINMFLIHGATGGGKTTILDAICYALYGVTSGDEREARTMRSHFAKEDQLTQVKLTFKVGPNKYYVHRIPGQERPKMRGEGYTYQNPEAELYIIEGKEKKQIAASVSRVTEKIVEIIGFDADQFRQVIMIPQGKFRDLLVARSEERQKILGEIFQTQKYKQVEERIREEEYAVREQVRQKKGKRIGQIKNIKYKEDTLLANLIEDENMDPDLIIEQVKILSKTQEDEINKMEDEIKNHDKELELMAKEINIATNNNQKYREKIRAKEEFSRLEEKSGFYKDKEKAYRLAQKALPLRTKEKYIEELENQIKDTKKEVKDIEAKIEEHVIKLDKAKTNLEEHSLREEEIKKLEIDVNRAREEYKPRLIEFTQYKKEKVQIEDRIKNNQENHEQLTKEKAKISQEILAGEKKLEKRQGLNDSLREQEVKLEKLTMILGERKDLEKLKKNHILIQKQYKEEEKALNKAKDEYGQASEEHNQIVQQWVEAQAGVLAKSLEDGKECPVCGSTNHPSPAYLTGERVTEDKVKEKKKQLDKAEKEYLKHTEKHSDILAKGNKSKETIKSRGERLGKYAEIELKDVEEQHKHLSKKIENTTSQLKDLEELEKRLNKQKEAILEIDNKINSINEKDKEYTSKFTTLDTQINQIRKTIPENLRNKEELDRHIVKLEGTIKDHNNAYEKAKKDLEEIKAKGLKLKTTQEEKSKQILSISNRHIKEKESFKVERERIGFITLQEYKDAYRSEGELEELDRGLKEYNSLYSAAKAQYIKLEEETKDIELVDIEKLNNQYRQEKENRDNLARRQQTIIVEKDHNDKQISIIMESNQEIKVLEKEYSIVGDLYKVARGENIKGLSFERFIQSSLFEDVLIRANERLTLMSNTRYELYRSDNRATKASHAGLDLEVLDTYTGKKRHVSTLSGGEGFMASLSLALGLADVVQSYAGGVSLETIFIDEGFGTLDIESLDASIQTLINLQQNGRLVGIISHVPELKDRIGARLEVVSSQSGSKAEFHI